MKQRLDILLVEKGFYETRNKARIAISNKDILVDSKVVSKPGMLIDINSNITKIKESLPYVSRGGLKLEKALKVFNVDVKDKVCLDVGSSTGGFSDCLLENGASKIYCVDVGSSQLANKLRDDKRIVSRENTDIRNIDVLDYKDVNVVVCDVSFISLKLIIPKISKLINSNEYILLIKPQFETLKMNISKNGLVKKDLKLHEKIINSVVIEAFDNGLFLTNLSYSPIKGDKSGNIEYLALFTKNDLKNNNKISITDVILDAFNSDSILD